ncbi:MAG: response regulator [Ruminiclostridium sp.]|nr:response regulator [Ruminiclostridium sp.]
MLGFNNEFYKKLFYSLDNNSVLMKVEKDGTYYPVWCSKEFTDMMEGTSEDFIRLESGGTMKTIHPDDRDVISYLFRHHVTRDGKNNVTVRKLTMSGKWIWVCINYAFISDGDDVYAYCTYFDVSELKESQNQAEAMYNELNKELNAMADDSLAALRSNLTKGVVEEVRGRDLYYTDRVGAKIEELLKARMDNMPLESDRENYIKTFDLENLRQRYYLGEQPASLVIFSKRQSGRRCFIRYSASMRKDPKTGDIIVLGVESEYNSEKVTEVLNSKVLASQYDMVSYVVSGSYGVVIGDPKNARKGNIFPRKKSGSYMDYIRDQVISAASAKHHDKNELLDALSPDTIEKKLEESEPYTVDIICDIGGELYNKRFAFYTVDKETTFYILLKSDMTDVVREQQERNEALTLALEEAKQANIAKTAFLSNMSHEIRTPMNAIIGLDNIALKEKNLSPETREQFEKINGSAKHLLGLINDILDMSRIESGRMVIKNEEFRFGAMLDQINTMISGQCRDKGLKYDCRVIGELADYYIGDDMKMKQVLINILGNAVKFTPEGGSVTFIVENAAQYNGQCTLRFVIRDTGIGMDEKYLPRLFDAFSQEDGATTNQYGGTGLGMAITKNIVAMMNGNISVKSKKGEGTEFTVNVTLKISDRKNDPDGAIRPQDMKVLVIDDDENDRSHAGSVLKDMGISADICTGGVDALESVKLAAARHEAYDLILVDLKMPDQNGIEVTRELRKITGSDSAVIILTAFSWDDIEDEAREAGVDGFMSKPLMQENVMSAFEKAYSTRNAASARRKHKADLSGKRILLAEDVAINAEIMKKILKMKGMTAEHAVNGKIAAEMFAASPEHYYDAVLMDVRMPVMDGLASTAEIRAMDRADAACVPIIAMTANAFDEDVQNSLQAGMNAHLSKPVEPDKLYAALEELIES